MQHGTRSGCTGAASHPAPAGRGASCRLSEKPLFQRPWQLGRVSHFMKAGCSPRDAAFTRFCVPCHGAAVAAPGALPPIGRPAAPHSAARHSAVASRGSATARRAMTHTATTSATLKTARSTEWARGASGPAAAAEPSMPDLQRGAGGGGAQSWVGGRDVKLGALHGSGPGGGIAATMEQRRGWWRRSEQAAGSGRSGNERGGGSERAGQVGQDGARAAHSQRALRQTASVQGQQGRAPAGASQRGAQVLAQPPQEVAQVAEGLRWGGGQWKGGRGCCEVASLWRGGGAPGAAQAKTELQRAMGAGQRRRAEPDGCSRGAPGCPAAARMPNPHPSPRVKSCLGNLDGHAGSAAADAVQQVEQRVAAVASGARRHAQICRARGQGG